jgi:hypothetical protein
MGTPRLGTFLRWKRAVQQARLKLDRLRAQTVQSKPEPPAPGYRKPRG